MNPEAIDLVDQFYDYSEQNLAFLQNKFDSLEIKTKTEIERTQKKEHKIEEEDEDEWEEYESEEEQKEESPKEEQYVLIRGFWHPLKDKIINKKFIKNSLEINEKDEVLLPGGKILGHRKYRKYYKQNMVEIVKKKSDIVKALAYREMNQGSTPGTVSKYESVVKTLER